MPNMEGPPGLPRRQKPRSAQSGTKETQQDLDLWNFLDEREVQSGKRIPMRVRAKAENGSMYTVIPKRIADSLALLPTGRVWVRFADGRRSPRVLVSGLRVRVPGLPGRVLTTDALVEPGRDTVLLGCEVMERMDLIADHRTGVLRPRPGAEGGQ